MFHCSDPECDLPAVHGRSLRDVIGQVYYDFWCESCKVKVDRMYEINRASGGDPRQPAWMTREEMLVVTVLEF